MPATEAILACSSVVWRDMLTYAGIRNHAGFFDPKAVKVALQQARVVFTTCAGAGSSQIALQQYALVIIDEASQVAHIAIFFQSKQPDTYQHCMSSLWSLTTQHHVSSGFVSMQCEL